MAGTWLVCAGEAVREAAARIVEALEPGAAVLKVADAAMARNLARSMEPAVSVCVGEGCGMEPVNMAAALVSDGAVRRTVLVAPGASGSLRSRAARAGVTEVVDPREGAGAYGDPAPSAEGGLCEERGRSAPAPSPEVDRGVGGDVGASAGEDGRGGRGATPGGYAAAPGGADKGGHALAPGVGGGAGRGPSMGRDAGGASGSMGGHGVGANGTGAGSAMGPGGGSRPGGPASATGAADGGGCASTPGAAASPQPDKGGAPAATDGNETEGRSPAAPGPNPLAERAAALTLAEGAAPVITLVSGRGGTGRSSIATMTALSAARWGMKVALVDLDLSFGNLFGFFGLAGPADLVPVAEGDVAGRLATAGVSVAEGVDLFGPCGSPEYAEVVAPKVTDIIDGLRQSHDLVVVDTSAAWGDAVAQAVQAADRVAIVGDERAGAIGSLARAAALAVRLGVARTRIVRVMNRCDARRRDEEFMTRATMGLEAARTFRVLEGTLDVAELMSAGHAPELVDLDNPFATSCAALVAKLLSDLGRLPEHEGARRARDAKVTRRRSVFSFAKAAG